jgi:uncharacterized protein YjbJ (UPF0337 family)
MNTLRMKGSWNKTVGKLKQQFANMMDDDMLFRKGEDEEVLGRLQQKLGKTKEDVGKIVGIL